MSESESLKLESMRAGKRGDHRRVEADTVRGSMKVKEKKEGGRERERRGGIMKR